MEYPRLYADRDGVSHFEVVEVDLPLVEYLPGEPMLGLAQPRAATTIVFAHLPAGWRAGRHPSPKAQFTITLAGELEVIAGDGERRRFGPGGVYLSGDTSGEGHESRAVGPDGCVLAIIPLAQEA
jgi:hypothetical protein